MDELKLLRLEPSDTRLTEVARDNARTRLRETIAASERNRYARSRLVVLAALTMGMVAASLLVGGGRNTPAPSVSTAVAHQVLARGADRIATVPAAPVPRGDQYLYAEELLVEVPVEGGAPERFVDESWHSVDATRPTRTSERGRSWVTAPSDGIWPPGSYEQLDALPTEPQALRRSVIDWFGGPGPTPADDRETEVTGLLMLLRGWRVMPPDLRAAIFRALAQLPDIRVRRGVADARGRRGLGISAPRAEGFGYEVIVDKRTFEYLGMVGRSVRNDGVEVVQRTALTAKGVVDEMGQRPADG